MPKPGCSWRFLLPPCIWTPVKWNENKPTTPSLWARCAGEGSSLRKAPATATLTAVCPYFQHWALQQPCLKHKHCFHVLLLEHMPSGVPKAVAYLPSVCSAPTPHGCSSKCLLAMAAFPTRVATEQTGSPVSPGAGTWDMPSASTEFSTEATGCLHWTGLSGMTPELCPATGWGGFCCGRMLRLCYQQGRQPGDVPRHSVINQAV